MRITADECYTHKILFHAYLDGVEVEHCKAIDTDEGWLDEEVDPPLDEDGDPLWDRAPIIRRYGVVTVKRRDDVAPPYGTRS